MRPTDRAFCPSGAVVKAPNPEDLRFVTKKDGNVSALIMLSFIVVIMVFISTHLITTSYGQIFMWIWFLRQLHFHPVRELNKPSSSVVLVVVLRTHLWFRDLSVPTYDTCSLSQLHQLWLIYKRYSDLLSSFRYLYCCTHQNVQVLSGEEGDPEDRPSDHECFVLLTLFWCRVFFRYTCTHHRSTSRCVTMRALTSSIMRRWKPAR